MTDPRSHRLRRNLQIRADLIHYIRRFFRDRNYLEVETPIRMPAPAPESHIDALPSEAWYLQTSPELCLKRMLSEGYPRIFQICKCFRKAERGIKHLPEFTMLEWYTAEEDYRFVMDQCEELIEFTADQMEIGSYLYYNGMRINIDRPWVRLTVSEAFDQFASVSMDQALSDGHFDELMGIEIEPNLGCLKPVFLYDYPAAMGSLARLKPEDDRYAERFELYMGGLELCNAFSELADAHEQRLRFAIEQENRQKSGKQAYPMPEKFLKSLERMPQASGNAMGIDRLVMLFTNGVTIDDVVAFVPEEL
jgi:elongation factor P--(R)-beta-lysine ligase